LDLPGQVHHLMIVRLPNAPVNQTWREILLEKYDEGKVQAIMSKRGQRHMLAKLQQGIGRGIRSKDDRVTVWVADSRFGIPEPVRMLRDPRVMKSAQTHSVMAQNIQGIIPTRFRPALNGARMFSAQFGVFEPKAPADLGKPKPLGSGMLKFLNGLPANANKGESHGNRA
jgi:ATP-dependent DNA helicase DinG